MRVLTDAALDSLREAASLPDLSGTRYSIIRKIGAGGMGAVYLAQDDTLKRRVALKVMHFDPSPEFVSRMWKESRIIAMLEHPSIVPIHDAGQLQDGRVFYVMKFVEGDSLGGYLQKLESVLDRILIMQRICDAVAFAHSRNVIHRDLKPENIMVGAFGEVLIMDFGVARIVRGALIDDDLERAGPGIDNRESCTAHGVVVGTPGFMAPEQARADSDSIDERADIYSLGAILYFLLTRRSPLEAVTNVTTLKASTAPGLGSPDQVIVRPRKLDPAIPRRMEAICLKAMAIDRQMRYRRVEEMADDLSRYLQGLPVSAYPEGLLERAGRLAYKYRVALVLILAYLAMRILLVFFFRT
jgi:eukaryotic-like serine/threonine-protein kinase